MRVIVGRSDFDVNAKCEAATHRKVACRVSDPLPLRGCPPL